MIALTCAKLTNLNLLHDEKLHSFNEQVKAINEEP